MPNWKKYTIRDLSGGMKWNQSPFLTEKTQMKYIVNYSTDKTGMFEKDIGYATEGNAIAGATSIMGMAPFYYTNAQKFVLAKDTGSAVDMMVFNPGTGDWTAQGLTLTTEIKYEFATFLDQLFCVNGSDATMSYNGTTWSTSTNVTGAPKAKYVVHYMDRLYLLNISVGGSSDTSRVMPSSLPDLTTYAITWDTSDTGPKFDVSTKDGDQIMGATVNFNRLLIFKEDSVWRYDTQTLAQLQGAPGTNNNRTIQTINGMTIYFHKTGVYGTNGDTTTKLSRDIQPFIDGVSSKNLDKLCSDTYLDNYYLYLGDVHNDLEHIDIPKCVVILNVLKNTWRIGTLEDQPTIFVKYRDDRSDLTYNDSGTAYNYYDKSYDSLMSANDFRFFGTDEGEVFKFDPLIHTQDSQNIRSYFETWNNYCNGAEGLWNAQALKFYMDDAKRIRLSYAIDDGAFHPINRYKEFKGFIYYQFPDGITANRIKFRGGDNGIGERVRIYGADVFYTPQANIV